MGKKAKKHLRLILDQMVPYKKKRVLRSFHSGLDVN